MNTRHNTKLAAACVALALGGPAWSAPAQHECYDFSGLAPDTKYTVGDVVNAQHAKITFAQYVTNGIPATAEARNGTVISSKIAGGAPPEMGMYLITVNVVPNSAVTKVQMKLGQSISQTGGFANVNIGVNGDRRESPTGFAGMNGQTLGNALFGTADIKSRMAPVGGNWHNGTLEMHATKGGVIRSFSIGGHSWRLDDLCFTK